MLPALGPFTNCNIYENTTNGGEGGGLRVHGGSVTFNNCPIRNNHTSLYCRGLQINGGTVTFINGNIYSNTASGA